MNAIQLAKHADFLTTRFLGELIRSEIESVISSEGSVIVDFRGVEGMSHSFADECFGDLFSRLGHEQFRSLIGFRDLTPQSRSILRFVFADRKAKPLVIA